MISFKTIQDHVSIQNVLVVFSLPNALITKKQHLQRCKDGVMNDFLSWCMHLHALCLHDKTSLYMHLFIEMTCIYRVCYRQTPLQVASSTGIFYPRCLLMSHHLAPQSPLLPFHGSQILTLLKPIMKQDSTLKMVLHISNRAVTALSVVTEIAVIPLLCETVTL